MIMSREKNGEGGVRGTKETPEEAKRTAGIRIKNRRKMYLDRHPSYFESPDLELADPLLYDRCVRRFQSAAEREADGRSKGYSGILEADLYRSEARLTALAHPDRGNASSSFSRHVTYIRGPDGQVLPENPDEIPVDREDGMKMWRHEMTMRFLRGEDHDFSYKEVDDSDEWDIIESKEAEESWFEDEEPQWVVNEGNSRQGETGVQDF